MASGGSLFVLAQAAVDDSGRDVPGLMLLGGAFLALVIYLMFALRIVRAYQAGVIEQFGMYKISTGPGLRLIVPAMQTMRLVDMREQALVMPEHEVMTADRAVVAVKAVVYYQPFEPHTLIYNVANFVHSVDQRARIGLTETIGRMPVDTALGSQAEIGAELREMLETATAEWGCHVNLVGITQLVELAPTASRWQSPGDGGSER